MAVAFSAGHDSTALLHATCAAAKVLGLAVVALHVHHGLLPEADAWLRHARAVCARWRRRGAPLRLLSARLQTRPAPGDSVEAWARRERYAALAALAKQAGAGLVLLAQHRRDQAETVLLQALRGAGPAGLAAMPTSVSDQGLVWARPWLTRPRQAIDAYLRRHRLAAVDDPSNADPRFARSRIRHGLWPALEAAFGDAEQALAAVASRAAEARSALSELAQLDLATCADARGIDLPAWRMLSPARQANALRQWCQAQLGVGPPETLVGRVLAWSNPSGAASWPAPGGMLRLYRGRLSFVPATQALPGSPPTSLRLDLSRPGRVAVPDWGGSFEVSECRSGGVAAECLAAASLRPRSGGERFQCQPRSQARSLKKQFQSAAVSPAKRVGPLVWADDRLLFVPGLGLDARVLAAAGQRQCRLRWLADAAA